MKNLKKTKAKLPQDERVIGTGVPTHLLNQNKLKKVGKLKKKA